MPTYEYLCGDCGQEFETFQSMKDDHLTDCILCGSEGTVKRKIGRGAGIIFKGSGFYETDFKDKRGGKTSDTASADNSGKSKASNDTKAGKKTESTASTSTKSASSE